MWRISTSRRLKNSSYAYMAATGVLNLGPLRLRAPLSWQFTSFGAMVLARTDAHLGTLQITLAYSADVPAGSDHAACLAEVRRFMKNEPEENTRYAERSDQTDAVFGHVTIHDALSFRRYWYRLKENGLILAVYQCKADQFSAAEAEIEEAGCIVATMELSAIG
jgi:hypothetical protein